MKIKISISFLVYDLKLKVKIDNALLELLKDFIIPKADIKNDDVFVDYKFEFDYDKDLISLILSKLNSFYDASGRKQMSPTCQSFSYRYDYSEEEMKNAELYKIESIGNVQGLYLSNKSGYESQPFCSTCQREVRVQTKPLLFNTAILKKRHVVFVDENLVVSRHLAEQFKNWNLSGYRLQEVIHSGSTNTEQGAFQLVPTNILPSQYEFDYLSSDPQVIKHQCPKCGVREHLLLPYCYEKSVLPHIKDFNLTQEYYSLGKMVIREMLISKRVLSLLTEQGIVQGVVSCSTHNEDEWAVVPILIN